MSYQKKVTPGQLTKPIFSKLDKVLPGVHGFNAYVRIEEVTRTEVQRFDNTTLTIAEGLCGDETGVIRFRVAGTYAGVLEKGKVVAWRNGLSEVFQGHHRLGLDAFGRLTVEDGSQVASANHGGKKYSEVEYEKRVVRDRPQRGERGDSRRRDGDGRRREGENRRGGDRRRNDRGNDRGNDSQRKERRDDRREDRRDNRKEHQ